MSAKQHSTSTIVTRSQAKKQTLTDTCVCTHTKPNSIMEPAQKEEMQAILNDLVLSLKQDMAKESHTQKNQFRFFKNLYGEQDGGYKETC